MCFVQLFSLKKRKEKKEKKTNILGEFIRRLTAPILHFGTWKNFGDSFNKKSFLVTLFIPEEMPRRVMRHTAKCIAPQQNVKSVVP